MNWQTLADVISCEQMLSVIDIHLLPQKNAASCISSWGRGLLHTKNGECDVSMSILIVEQA